MAPKTHHEFPANWLPSEALCSDAVVAGVVDLAARLLSLRTGPIGGTRGVLDTELENYVRTFFGRWRTWAETDRAKAANAAKPRAQSYRRGEEPPAELVDFDPRYLDASHRTFCDQAKLGSVESLAREWRVLAIKEGKPLTKTEADKAFARWLGKRAKKARAA